LIGKGIGFHEMKKYMLLLLIFLIPNSLMAETLFTCGASAGYTYIYEGGLIGKEQAGWSKDAISKGSLSLVKQDDKLDILYIDATKKIHSSRAAGAGVFLIDSDENYFTVLVGYVNAVAELYTFDIKNKKFSHSVHKYGTQPIIKATTMVGNCD